MIVEFFDVCTIEACNGCGDSAVDDELGCSKAGDARCCLPLVVKSSTANGEMHVFFLWIFGGGACHR